MKKIEAQEVAEKYLAAIVIHYQAELEKLQRLRAEATSAVRTWVDSGAYRKKGCEAPFVETHTMQRAYGVGIFRAAAEATEVKKHGSSIRQVSNDGVTWVDAAPEFQGPGRVAPRSWTYERTIEKPGALAPLRVPKDGERMIEPMREVNVCEHGDHAAPMGHRFCSDACAKCETEDAPEGEECAGICRK